MHLQSLVLTHFKNYTSTSHAFTPSLNLITGLNGTGKTNLLDAIYFLCNTKSAFLSSDLQAIQHNQPFFRVEGHFSDQNKESKIECVCQREGGKLFLSDGKAPDKLADHIGRFPVVLTTPYDTDLIREGSEIRRKFFDQILSHSMPGYLDKLLVYNRQLKQRNALLKQFAESGRINANLLAVYDDQLLPLNKEIADARNHLLVTFLPMVAQAYQSLADLAENIHIEYKSDVLGDNFLDRYLTNHRNDLHAQRTLLGIHTDDFEFTFNQSPLKKLGSQGQQKTFVLALRLAHFHYVHQVKGKKPILLLDDIFDRLDENRIQRLAQLIHNHTFGQVFVTDANPQRVVQVFQGDLPKLLITT